MSRFYTEYNTLGDTWDVYEADYNVKLRACNTKTQAEEEIKDLEKPHPKVIRRKKRGLTYYLSTEARR